MHVGTLDPDTDLLISTMEALGFDQLIDFSTHKCDNILDLVFVEADGNMQATKCEDLGLFSDHILISIETTINKPPRHRLEKSVRNIKAIDTNSFGKDCQTVLTNDSVDDLAENFDNLLTTVLNKHAPTRSKMVTQREKKIWFSNEILQQKQRVRK